MFDELIEALKAAKKKTIVFTEGTDERILEATDRLVKGGFLQPILVGNEKDVKAAAKKGGFDIDGVEIVDSMDYKGMALRRAATTLQRRMMFCLTAGLRRSR